MPQSNGLRLVERKLTHSPFPLQIDLESSDDDIQEIQQEISVLSTCASPFVTRYKASFLRGHKLWIVMEFLGGGSCLDLVRILLYSPSSPILTSV